MTREEMSQRWHEPLANSSFEAIGMTRSNRRHMHAFLLLDELDPWPNGTKYPEVVAQAEHDEIWLGFNEDHVARVITPEQIVELRRCGVHYTDDGMGFHMGASS